MVTSPIDGTNTSASSINTAFTVNGSTTIPAGTTCTVNGTSTTSTSTNNVALVLGGNTITVACTNAFGVGSNAVTVDRGNVPIGRRSRRRPTARNTAATSINTAYTVNGSTTIPAGTTCTVNGTSIDQHEHEQRRAGRRCQHDHGHLHQRVRSGQRLGHGHLGQHARGRDHAPANNTFTTAPSTNVTYTVNGGTTIPAGTTCTVNGTSSTSTSTNIVTLSVGANTISVQCTNSFGAGQHRDRHGQPRYRSDRDDHLADQRYEQHRHADQRRVQRDRHCADHLHRQRCGVGQHHDQLGHAGRWTEHHHGGLLQRLRCRH